uniref:Uncharacterized protein n=1 Tax=mine drainage metagenome TaxID=410659 RepID=E6Q6X6_9ZZZZ
MPCHRGKVTMIGAYFVLDTSCEHEMTGRLGSVLFLALLGSVSWGSRKLLKSALSHRNSRMPRRSVSMCRFHYSNHDLYVEQYS